MKNKNWIFGILIITILAAALVWQLAFPGTPVTVNIPVGAKGREVAHILKQAKLISSEKLFLAAAKILGASKKFKEGIYDISPRTGMIGIVRIIAGGRSRLYRVTIPEGLTSAQIADLIFSSGTVNSEKFQAIVKEKKLEGYLFPQTYFFDPGISPEKIIDMMVSEFNRNYTEELKKRAKEIKLTDNQAITLASIIEKEAKLPEERPRISAVFHNRLKKRWYLESCATVLYALGEHKEVLLNRDLKVDSSYNTYKHIGLPPGPICNPGIESIKAALYPAATNEMYFVVSSSGAHVFSCNLEEHVKNKKVMKNARKKNLSRS